MTRPKKPSERTPINGKSRRRSSATLQRFQGNDLALSRAKASFLTSYREGWSIRKCAEGAGVERTTIWRWRQVDSDFDGLYRAAREDGTDVYRDLAYDQARAGNVAAIALVLRFRGALPRADQVQPEDEMDIVVGAKLTVEELVQRAVEQGVAIVPAIMDGEGIVTIK